MKIDEMTPCLCILKDMNNSRRWHVVSLHFNSAVFCAPIEKRGSRLLLFVTLQYRSRSEYRYFAFLPILRAFKTVRASTCVTQWSRYLSQTFTTLFEDEREISQTRAEAQMERPAETWSRFLRGFRTFLSLNERISQLKGTTKESRGTRGEETERQHRVQRVECKGSEVLD